MIRKYGASLEKTAAIIASEVVEFGFSTGWMGTDFNFFNKLKEYLSKFNIAYVDDLRGEWQYRN